MLWYDWVMVFWVVSIAGGVGVLVGWVAWDWCRGVGADDQRDSWGDWQDDGGEG